MFKSVFRVKVEWGQCDPAGLIFNPHYYIWMDQATHRLFDAIGYSFVEHTGQDGFLGCALVSSGADFVSPAYYGDVLTLTSQAESFGHKSYRMRHVFRCGEREVARGFEVRIWAIGDADDPKGLIAAPIPDLIKEKLSRNETVDVSL